MPGLWWGIGFLFGVGTPEEEQQLERLVGRARHREEVGLEVLGKNLGTGVFDHRLGRVVEERCTY
jgi:hypothetical protein